MERPMSSVIWHVTMSLDGFIAGRDVIVFGANLAQQCLRAGLLDEIVIHLVPVLLGEGIRLIDTSDFVPVALERTLVATSGQITDLRFTVRRSG
jgi:riboflavin biosynthesis pyrimidine reductase